VPEPGKGTKFLLITVQKVVMEVNPGDLGEGRKRAEARRNRIDI